MDFETPEGKLFSKKNIIGLLVIGIILLIIPVGMKFLQSAQIIKSRADVDPITIVVPQSNVVCDSNQQNCVASSNSFDIELRSPLGPAAPPPNVTYTPTPPPPTRPPAAGSVPQNLNAVCGAKTGTLVSVEFTWTPITGAQSYKMTVANANATSSPLKTSVPARQDIFAGLDYTWTVASCTGADGTGCGASAPVKSLKCN